MTPEVRARYESEEQLRIHEEVGRGGYGCVYRAHHLRLDTPVAVKVLNAHVQAMPSVIKLFAREARVMARIDHPNVLRVFDYSEGPEGPYIVTEWMAGGAVANAADEGRLRSIASSTASALQALHEAAVVHRDVKPANLMVRGDGRIKLGDLGVALAADDASDRQQFVGTIPYMAPELFEDEPRYSAASDIYALGISLYQLWSGVLPYLSADLTELADLIRRAEHKPLPALRGGLSAGFVRLLHAMMGASPSARPTSNEIVRQLAGPAIAPALSPRPPAGPSPTITAIGTPPPSDGAELQRIGLWVIAQEIYRGTTWHTFFGHHSETGRQVRIGRLLGDWLLPVPVMLEAAVRSSRWAHPSMVTVLDWGTWDGRPYFVTGTIGVRLLDTIQATGSIGELEALRLIEEVADVVAHLHARGYVYQMIDVTSVGSRPSGTGWMLDWPAFAMKIGSAAKPELRYASPFCAPEAVTAPTFDASADVYALGTLLASALADSAWMAARTHDRTFALPDQLPSTAATRSLILALTAKAPADRPTAAEARDWAAAIRRRLAPLGETP